MRLPFLYQLQNAGYASLSATDFGVAVVDMDDAGLTAAETAALERQGKGLLTYLSIGEAEDYRDYWQAGWASAKPAWLLGENPDWPGNHAVKFWDPAWQKLVYARVDAAIEAGYQGIYLDIVDAYETAQVRKAWPGTAAELRQAMIDFVTGLSAHARAERPGFLVVPQNAVGLLALDENDPGVANAAYLEAIDGLGVEDLWYDGDRPSGWTEGDLELIRLATAAGKFVLATSYPTEDARQEAFVTRAIDAGLIPFVGDRELTGRIDPVDRTIAARLAGHDVTFPDFSDTGAGGGLRHVDLRIAENHASVIAASSASLPDAIRGGADAALFALDARGLHFRQAPDFERPEDAGRDNVYRLVATEAGRAVTIRVTVTDAEGKTVAGSDRSDTIDGTPEGDSVRARDGDDRLHGQGGDDFLYGAGGNDTIDAGAGNDLARGGRGRDSLAGGPGDDLLFGRRGDDRVAGDAGNDLLHGGGGNDLLDGGAGRDRLWGDKGDDRLAGGAGNDLLFGGAGSDTLVFVPGGGADRVGDFDKAHDLLDLTAFSGLRFAVLDSNRSGLLDDGDARVSVVDGHTDIDLGDAGAAPATVDLAVTGLGPSDFVFEV
jgi:uncharacterized protein (TIGR01370 family)